LLLAEEYPGSVDRVNSPLDTDEPEVADDVVAKAAMLMSGARQVAR
jgi:hypothetical protein